MIFSKKDKINMYLDCKNGKSKAQICREYGVSRSTLYYLFSFIELNGIEEFKNHKKKYFSNEEKEELIKKAINGEASVKQLSLENKIISNILLKRWINNYKKNNGKYVSHDRVKSRGFSSEELYNILKDLKFKEHLNWTECSNYIKEKYNVDIYPKLLRCRVVNYMKKNGIETEKEKKLRLREESKNNIKR